MSELSWDPKVKMNMNGYDDNLSNRSGKVPVRDFEEEMERQLTVLESKVKGFSTSITKNQKNIAKNLYHHNCPSVLSLYHYLSIRKPAWDCYLYYKNLRKVTKKHEFWC